MRKNNYLLTVLITGIFFFNSISVHAANVIDKNDISSASVSSVTTDPVILPENTVSLDHGDAAVSVVSYDPVAEPASPLKPVQRFQTIFVGDSRFTGMRIYAPENNAIWIEKVGAGYRWYNDEACKTLTDSINKSIYGANVIVNLGVNDLGNVDKYIEAMKDLAGRYADDPVVHFYYMSVNPVGKTTVTNDQIIAFNEKIKSELSDSFTWIDTYNYLSSEGIGSTDGLHYNKTTTLKIYNYAMSAISAE